MKDFDRALEIVLAQEGGYSDDARDPGGATMYGITERVARANGYNGPMRALPMSVASSIYWDRYWKAASCDELPWPLSLYVFDCAVNQGVSAAIRLLQTALDTVQDGVVGPTTLRLAREAGAWHQARFMALRANRYVGTKQFERFGTGWMIRLFEVVRAGETAP